MPRYIRYLENGEYKYASVKPVGDIEKLKIDAPDLVTAINSLVDGGVIELVQGKVDELQKNIDNVNSTVTSQGQTIQQQAVTIENQSQLVYQLQVDLIDTKKLQDDLQASQNALQTDYEQTVADLSQTKADLEKKLDYAQYQDQYSALVEQLSNKAESIDVQSIVESLNQDITNQTIEVDQAKTDIVTLDTKVDTVKTDVLADIDNVQSNVDALNQTVADQRADTLSRISDVQTKATNDLNTAKTELNSSISSVQQSVTDLDGKVNTIKTDLTNKINTDITNANNAIDAVEERVSQSEADISTANANIANAQQSISQTQSDLSATKQDLANAKTDLANTKTNLQGQIDNTKQSVTDLTGRITNSEQDIADINTDIATVKQFILTTQSNLSGTQQDLADAKEELQGSIVTVQQKADANAQAIQGIDGDITTINSDIDTINGQISTTITDVTSLKGRVSTAESNITENANQIATKVSQLTYDTDMKGVKDRITNTESTLVQQAGLIASKVEQTDYNALEGRVTNQQTTIEQMADQISQKVEHSEYDELTQQVSTQETSILQSASDIQLLASRATSAEGRLDSAETSIKQNADAIALKAEASSVYTKTDVDSKLGTKVDSKTYSDKIAEIELNANSITQRVSDTEGDIDTISGNVTNLQSNVSTLQQTSTQIQSTVSGIQEDVSSLDGRLDSAETQITQTKDAITLKADQTTVDAISGRVDDAEAQLSVQAGQIATKVEQTTYTTDKTNLQSDINSRAKQSDLNATNNNLSNLTGRVSTAESSITENANEIATKVAQSDYNRDISGLTTRISSAETSIQENANAIALKASQSTVDDLSKSIASTQAELVVQANQIASKVEQSVYDELDSRVVNQQTTIEQMADQISQKVEHSEYDELTNQVSTQETSILQTASDVQILATKSEDLDGRLSTAEASITTQAGQIALKAESKDVYTKSDVDTKLGTKVDTSTYQTKMSEIDVTTSGITQRVEATEGDIDTITGDVSNIQSDVSTLQQTSTQIQSTVTGIQSDVDGLDGRLSTAETNITQNKNDIALRAKQTDLDSVTGRVSSAESQLSVQAGQIASKVEQTTYTTDKKALQDSIATKANASDLSALTGRVTTAESSITQQANQIQQKVNTTDVYLKGDVDTMLANGNIYVRGTGLNHGGNRVLKINGKTIYDEGGRGFKLTTINRSTLAVVDNILYDVYGSDQPKNDLADKLNSLDTSVLVVLTSFDAIATNSALNTAIANFGGTGTQFGGTFHRVPYALIGMKGIGKGAGIEVFTSVDATATPVAEISTKIVNGIPQGFNTSVTALDKRVTTAETTITQQANQISLKANASDVYTKSDVDTKLGTKVDSTTYNNKVAEIKVTTDNISSNVSNIQSTVNTQTGQITQLNSDVSAVNQKADSISSTVTSLSSTVDSHGQKITQHDTSITQLNNSIALKANASDVYTKSQADGAITTAVNNTKAEIKLTTDAISQSVSSLQTTTSDHEQRLTSQQTTVEQLADQISQKVEYTDYDQLNQQVSVQETQILQTSSDITLLANRTTQAEGRLDVAEASIQLNSDSIKTKVEQTDFDSLKGTVTSQGTSITQLNNQIALKAEASNVYTKSQTDSMVNAKVDTSTYNSKVAEIKLTTDNITQSVSDLSSDLDTTNSNVSAVDQKANSIQSSVTSLTNTVNSQGQTISSQGTSITQLNNQIALKAEASNVYTKSESDSKLGTKVDTTTYNAKVAEIKATTDGITSSVSATNSKIDNLQIGGRNYYKMKSFQGAGGVTAVFDDNADVWNVTIPSGSTSSWRGISYNAKNAILRAGRTYTVSFEVYADSVIPLYADINNQGLTTNVSGNDNDVTSKRIYNFPSTVAGRWTKASFTFTMPDTITQDFYDYSTLGVANGWTPSANTTIKIKNMKLEEGNKATDWQPAVEDMNDNFDALSQSISSVDQKADSIQSSVSSLTTTVNSQGTRLTNAETTITQHTNSINLKANSSDVYTKSQVDTSLGKKVDTTTYNNKMSSIDVSINGINQTVSDQSTDIDNLTGTVTNHTSQISSVTQKADGLSTTVTQVQNDLSGLTGRVSTAETNISQNTNAIALKASQSSVDSLGTRVTNAESSLSVQAGQIASKVSQTDYDSAVGVNKWVASKYDMTLANSSVIPTFDHIKGKTPSAVIDYADSSTLDAFDGDYYMTHYFTNIYMKGAKTVTLTVSNDDGASIFLNGASIYGKGSTGTGTTSVSVAFRAGWNTLDILHYEHSGAEKVSLGTTISSQVDKMTSVIGVGNKNETRMVQAETAIIQTNNAIALKADSTTVTAIGNRVTNTESSITLLNNQIVNKVEQSDFDAYSQRLSTAESNITQNTNTISTLVKKTDFDSLNGRVTTAESSITQLNNSITQKASQTSVDSLAGRVTTAEGTLSTQATQIASKVSQSTFDAMKIGGRNIVLGTATAKTATGTGGTNQCTNLYDIAVNYNNSLAGKEITISFDIVSSTSSGTAIVQWNNTPWGYLSGSIPVSTTSQHIVKTVTQPSSGSATGVQVRLDNLTGTVTISNLKIEIGNRATDYTVAPEDTDQAIENLDGRLTTAETSITQTSNQIALKANSADVYTKSATDSAISSSISSAKAEIKLTTDGISSNVSSLQSIVANNSQQLIRNSTFTDGTNGLNYWSVASGYWTLDTSKAVDGANAMLAVVTGQTTDVWKQIESEYVDIKAGQKINGSWYTMVDDLTVDEGRGYGIELEFYNASGTRISASGKQIKPSAVNTWQRFDYTTTAPVGAVKARLRAHPYRNGKIWVSRPMLVLGDTVPSAFSVMPNESLLRGMNASIDTLNNSITSKVTQTDINNSIDAMKINGRNLLYNSTGKLSDDNNQALGWSANTFVDVIDGKPALRVNNSSTGETTRSSNTIAVKPSTSYVLKGLVKGSPNAKGYDIFWLGKKSGSTNTYDYSYNITGTINKTALTATNELVFTTKADEVSGFIRIDNNGKDGTTYKDDDGVTDISDSTVWFSEILFQEGTKGTSWSPAPEDLYDQIDDAYARISSAEEKITDDAIINTVSTTIQNAVAGKADASDLAGYATSGDLDNAVAQMGTDVDAKLSALDFVTPSVLATELDQTNKDFEFKIQQSGGVNLIRNSVGFADLVDSPVWTLSGTVNTIQSDELDKLGFGSGFYVPNGVTGYIEQKVNVIAGEDHTLSFYLKKSVDNASNGWAGVDLYQNGTKLTFQGLGAGAGTTTDGYQQFSYTFNPTMGEVVVRVTVGSNADAIITGLMMNIGSHPRQWSMANGEVYNTNVKVDINGIKVLSNQYDGFTSISPEEFAGYASVADETTGVATMTKVFTLNKDVTEMSKVDVDKEIAMNPIRIIPIQSGSNNGWAFLPSI